MSRETEFSSQTKQVLMLRAANMCSNPNCRRITSGPAEEKRSRIVIGEAAHIYSSKLKGPRYISKKTVEELKDIDNGIWLCRNCHKIIDSDTSVYFPELLKKWKIDHEKLVTKEIVSSTRLVKEKNSFSPIYQMIELLKKEKIFSKVYLAFLLPRTIEDCKDFVFGRNKYKISVLDMNERVRNKYQGLKSNGCFQKLSKLSRDEEINSLNSTINILMKYGFIIRNYDNTTASYYYRSTYLPIFLNANKKLVDRAESSKSLNSEAFNEVDEQLFNSLFTSIWFKNCLEEFFFDQINGPPWIGLDISRYSDGSLFINGDILYYLADFIEVIGTISMVFARELEEFDVIPKINDIKFESTFDNFANIWYREKIAPLGLEEEFLNRFNSAKKYLGNYESTNNEMDIIYRNLKFILCIPLEFSEKLSRIERIQLTVYLAFTS